MGGGRGFRGNDPCDRGGGDGGGAPSISNLRYAPTSALQQPDGTLTIDGTVDFADRDRDLVRMRLVTSAGADLVVDNGAVGSVTGSGAAWTVSGIPAAVPVNPPKLERMSARCTPLIAESFGCTTRVK